MLIPPIPMPIPLSAAFYSRCRRISGSEKIVLFASKTENERTNTAEILDRVDDLLTGFERPGGRERAVIEAANALTKSKVLYRVANHRGKSLDSDRCD
jgi:hypothetical protein